MTFNHVKLDESILPKNLGKKGLNQNGIRIYEIGGINMPSVTSILGNIPERKVKIESWRNAVGEKMANYISVSATNRGKTTHTLIENHLNNEDDKSVGITAVTPLGLFRIVKPYLARIDNIHMLEEIIYSKEIGVAGQVDCIAEYKGKLSVIDFKTSTKDVMKIIIMVTFYNVLPMLKCLKNYIQTKRLSKQLYWLLVKMDLYKNGYTVKIK